MKWAPTTLCWILYFQGSQDSPSPSSHLLVPQAALKGGLEEADNRQNSAAPHSPALRLLIRLCFHLKDDGLINSRSYNIHVGLFFFNLTLQQP